MELKLCQSGYIHIATDWEAYALEIITLVEENKFLKYPKEILMRSHNQGL